MIRAEACCHRPVPCHRPVVRIFWLATAVLAWTSAVAAFDPAENIRWRSGLHFPGFDRRVMGLGVYQDRLVAAGMFTLAGRVRANSVAILDGTSWKDLGSGLGQVRLAEAVTMYGDELIVGGDFGDGHNVVAWDGTRWRPLGSFDAPVSALAVYRGNLVATGPFRTVDGTAINGIARRDGDANRYSLPHAEVAPACRGRWHRRPSGWRLAPA